MSRTVDVLVIGAGMAGLTAASRLAAAGLRVLVVDKGRRHGGRMATRRVDDAVFDTGVLRFAARSTAFRAALRDWASVERVVPDPDHAAHAWRGRPMMRSLPAALAQVLGDGPAGTEVRLATQVTALARDTQHWTVATTHDGAGTVTTSATALVMTAPAPQALALLDAGSGSGRALVSPATREVLADVRYLPSLTVLARPVAAPRRHGGPSGTLGDSAAVGPGTSAPDLLQVHHNDRTGASKVPAITLQATPAFSAVHLDADRSAAAAMLVAQASAVVGTELEVVHVHGWRYAQVERGVAAPALLDDSSGSPIVLAGDLFTTFGASGVGTEGADGPPTDGVERAFLSGDAGAELLLRR